MQVKLVSFGNIKEIVGEDAQWEIDVANTDELNLFLHHRFPELRQMKYRIAVNEQIIQSNSLLYNNVTVALLPPFSGG